METINSSKDVKNLFDHSKEMLNSPEMLLVIVIIGSLIKMVLPEKIDVLITHLKVEYITFIGGLIDLIIWFLIIICSFLLVFHFVSALIHGLLRSISDKSRNGKDFKITEILYRGIRGSHIRIILISRWLLIMVGLLFIFNESQFTKYTKTLSNSIIRFENNIWLALVGVFILIVLIQCCWFAFKSIYFKYIDLYSIRNITTHYE